MAASTPGPLERTTANMRPNPARKIRVIAKIRSSTDREAAFSNEVSVPWISVNKPKGDASDSVTVTFGEQSASRKEAYEVHFCYEQNEGNDMVFTKEVKPLISGVFDGHNATIIAYGARGSGKTYMVQGSDREPGLAVLAMAEILPMAKDSGNSITVSFYEINQDHVYDLLDPKPQEVLVWEDAQGKIQLKGLSRVPVTSMSEFQKLYIGKHSSHKPVQKIAAELPHRSHKGLIVYVSSHGEKLDSVPVGKMNFVDLAGYEDARRSNDGLNFVEKTKINKSIHALQNVIYSLKVSESHVPYRESKLTRMLQDSLGGTSRILMIACLNPSLCQDSIYMVNLASRCHQDTNRAVSYSTKKPSSSAKLVVPTAHKSQILGSVCSNVKKHTAARICTSGKKMASSLKARKLFDEASHLKSDKATTSDSEIVSATETSSQEEEKSSADVAKETVTLKEDSSLLALDGANSVSLEIQKCSTLAASGTWETSMLDKDISMHSEDNHDDVTPGNRAVSVVEECENIDKENNSSFINEAGSPSISAQLRELSNSLKLLYSGAPTYVEMAPKNDASFHSKKSTDFVEPGTPVQSMKTKDMREVGNFCSPWEMFNTRSSGMKNSMVQEYLKFLNSANKEELKKLKGIGEKRATYILELREQTPEPFKDLDDLEDIGLTAKQVKGMIKKEIGGLFN